MLKAIIGGTLAAIAIVVIGTVVYQGGWWVHNNSVNREYKINRTGQAMQAAQIAQARDLEDALIITTNTGQKVAFTTEFCQVFVGIDPGTIPADLVATHTADCH